MSNSAMSMMRSLTETSTICALNKWLRGRAKSRCASGATLADNCRLRLQLLMAAFVSKHWNYPKVSNLKLLSSLRSSRNSLDNQCHSHKLSCKRPRLSLLLPNVSQCHTNSRSLSSSQTGTIIRSLAVRSFLMNLHLNINHSLSNPLGTTTFLMTLKNPRPCSPSKINN